jgi:hypothetical protein
MVALRRYDSNPHYPAEGSSVASGWTRPCASLRVGPAVIAIDGPAVLDWSTLIEGLARALAAIERPPAFIDVRAWVAPWQDVVRRTAPVPALAEDHDFATLAAGSVRDLFDTLPTVQLPSRGGIAVVFGPGAALVDHQVLWYADLPKRYAEAEITRGSGLNLGQPADDGPGTLRRLFYIDWPLIDRHRDALLHRIDWWIDARSPSDPTAIEGQALRDTARELATRPFRTRPTFNTVSWGGHWGQQALGMNVDAPNTGVGYELIAPESGVLIGGPDAQVEVPFQVIVALETNAILGEPIARRFARSFPIRFDYLDTLGGGNLSIHCHPQADYMRQVFGWPYAQHEAYYVMVGGEDGRVFLGLRDDTDVSIFHKHAHDADEHGVAFDIGRFVQSFPATPHQLFSIPVGTPHGSGEGNVILEVSATPYLYSLRFYDWLRRDGHGNQRPVHVAHAFANLDRERRGASVSEELVRTPRKLRRGAGWQEELLSRLPNVFYEVRRLTLQEGASLPDDTGDRFHVLNVVAGEGIHVTTSTGATHDVAYAETVVVPAAVGMYRIAAAGADQVRVVKAVVS